MIPRCLSGYGAIYHGSEYAKRSRFGGRVYWVNYRYVENEYERVASKLINM